MLPAPNLMLEYLSMICGGIPHPQIAKTFHTCGYDLDISQSMNSKHSPPYIVQNVFAHKLKSTTLENKFHTKDFFSLCGKI